MNIWQQNLTNLRPFCKLIYQCSRFLSKRTYLTCVFHHYCTWCTALSVTLENMIVILLVDTPCVQTDANPYSLVWCITTRVHKP